jgi:NADH-quinone oxidoreductase subunit C
MSTEITDEIAWVPHGEWVTVLADARRRGLTMLDLLTAVDRPEDERVDVIAHVVGLPSAGTHGLAQEWWGSRLEGSVPLLTSIAHVFAGASWHERELHEMFGIAFVNATTGALEVMTPLLLSEFAPAQPLRKHMPLVARAVKPWPGAADPDARRSSQRRRQLPPGVLAGWLREDTAGEDSTND